MDRREFLKKGSLFTTSLLIPSFVEARTIKNKYHFIMPPKPFEYFIKEGKKKGGRVLIIGGIHGNEEGSYKASDILIETELKRGTLAILPRSNPESIFTHLRGYNGDMNRKFNYISKRDNDYYKVNSIKNFIAEFKPDVILSLHDGYGFYGKNKHHWGESLVIDEAEYNKIPLYQIAHKVGSELKKRGIILPINNTKTFSKHTHHKEQRKSLTFYSLQKHSVPAFCIEASKQTSLERKVKIHLHSLEQFFKIYGVEIEPSFDYIFSNLQKYLEIATPKILISVGNEKKIIQSKSIIKIPKGKEIKFEILNARGGGVIAKNVNVNYRSFFYSGNLEFLVKNDNVTKYSFIIRS
jgi:hypothetical protein